jgi:hypothetical protein
MRSLVVSLSLLSLLGLALPASAAGPSGTFKNDAGEVVLKYLGEGTVEVKLKTKYCSLESKEAATFVPNEGIHVLNAKKETVLVIFYRPASIIVYGELPALKQYCTSGKDATGVYKRAKK